MESINLGRDSIIEIKPKNDQTGPPEIDWDVLENIKARSLKPNKRIKKHPNDSGAVYSHERYAQDLYETYFGKLSHLKEPNVGESITGMVSSMNENIAFIDIGWREDAYLDLRKEHKEYIQYIRKGYEIEVLIESIDSRQKNPISASYTKNIMLRKKEELVEAIGEPVAYKGKVNEIVANAGYYVNIDGIKCFMPGSLGGINKLVDFKSILGKELYVVPINYSKEKDYVVVSHRDYLKSLIPDAISQLQIGESHKGFVTGCSKHGIFVEFNTCLTGLISTKDISEENIDRFNSRNYRPGDELDFFIKDILDNGKIVLSQNPVEPSAWNKIEDKYSIPSMVTGTIKKISKYGLFVEIEPKVVGLLRKSYLDENDVFEVGQDIEVKITKIDREGKKIDFAL